MNKKISVSLALTIAIIAMTVTFVLVWIATAIYLAGGYYDRKRQKLPEKGET